MAKGQRVTFDGNGPTVYARMDVHYVAELLELHENTALIGVYSLAY